MHYFSVNNGSDNSQQRRGRKVNKYKDIFLNKALEIIRAGYTLVVWKLDRLGRSLKQLVELISNMHKIMFNLKV